MNNDRILKKSLFGGFNREDVLGYVEKLQSENVSLAEELREKSAQCAEQGSEMAELDALREANALLRAQVNELTERDNQLSALNSELSAAKNKYEAMAESSEHELSFLREKSLKADNALTLNAELEARVLSAEAKAASLEEEIASLKANPVIPEPVSAPAEEKSTEYDDTKLLALESELAQMKERFAVLESDYLRLSEEKSNALIRSAVSYSDALIGEARETADRSILVANASIASASSGISDASKRLRAAQVNLEYSLSSIRNSVDNLITELSKQSSGLTPGE